MSYHTRNITFCIIVFCRTLLREKYKTQLAMTTIKNVLKKKKKMFFPCLHVYIRHDMIFIYHKILITTNYYNISSRIIYLVFIFC